MGLSDSELHARHRMLVEGQAQARLQRNAIRSQHLYTPSKAMFGLVPVVAAQQQRPRCKLVKPARQKVKDGCVARVQRS